MSYTSSSDVMTWTSGVCDVEMRITLVAAAPLDDPSDTGDLLPMPQAFVYNGRFRPIPELVTLSLISLKGLMMLTRLSAVCFGFTLRSTGLLIYLFLYCGVYYAVLINF